MSDITQKFKAGDKVKKANGARFNNGARVAIVTRVLCETLYELKGLSGCYTDGYLELADCSKKHLVRFRDTKGNYLSQVTKDYHDDAVDAAKDYLKKNAGHSAELFELEGVFKSPEVKVSYEAV